jgi:hypothetical protein
MDRIEDDVSYSSSIVACVFVAAVTLPSRYLATIGGYIDAQTDGGIYEYTVYMGSGAMICSTYQI